MTTHSSVLAWRIPGTGEPGGLPSTGSHRVGHDWSDLATSLACIFYSLPETSFHEAAELFTQVFLMRAPLSLSKTSKVKRNLQLDAAHEAKGQSPLKQEEKINLNQNVNSLHHYILDTQSRVSALIKAQYTPMQTPEGRRGAVAGRQKMINANCIRSQKTWNLVPALKGLNYVAMSKCFPWF